jgi:hypothetical protein
MSLGQGLMNQKAKPSHPSGLLKKPLVIRIFTKKTQAQDIMKFLRQYQTSRNIFSPNIRKHKYNVYIHTIKINTCFNYDKGAYIQLDGLLRALGGLLCQRDQHINKLVEFL